MPETTDQNSMFPTLGLPPSILPKSADSKDSGLPG